MIYVAFGILAFLALFTAYVGDRVQRGRERAWERKEMTWAAERKMLLDRIMYLADRPWDMPAQEIGEAPESTSYDPTMQPIDTGDFDYHYNPAGVV